MRQSLLKMLRSPKSREPLMLYIFESVKSPVNSEEDVTEGILVAAKSNRAYPITNGVPVMLESSFTRGFLQKHAEKISQNEMLSKLSLCMQKDPVWSFSTEWNYHFDFNLTKTWGWTIDERVQQFFLETDTKPDEINGRLILDAGCGNGQLSEELSKLAATVVAMDYSTSVFVAEKFRKLPNVHFIQGDLQAPPFEVDTFDIIISNGVIHHTPDTYKTFVEVAKLVKPGGCFYLWLYRKPEKFFRRYFLYTILDLMRITISRLPSGPQAIMVKIYAVALMVLHKILGRAKHRSWRERVVLAYDSLTPLWRHYHTPLQLSCWFFMNGYSYPTITHWDNPYGFGMVATKKPQADTPGVNFGRRRIAKRYWQ